MKCIILADKRRRDDTYMTEEGLSIYIESDENKLLLDCGLSDSFIHNSKLIGINLNEIETIVLSHGHYDHGDGLKYISNKTIVLHPDCTCKRYSKRRNGVYAGINQNKEELLSKFKLIEKTYTCELFNNIYYLGQINRKYEVPAKNLPTLLKDNEIDLIQDDTGLVIKTDKGIIVFGSCSHSGIDNIIEQAKLVTHDDRVLSVIGGFHLREIDSYTDQIIKYFIDNHIQSTYMGHCTKDEVIDYFKDKLKGYTEVHKFYVGDVIVV